MVSTPKQRQVSLDNIYHIQNSAGKSLALTTFFASSPSYPLSLGCSTHFRADWVPKIGASQPSGLDY